MIKEKLKDIGRTIIGKGPEVGFKNDAEKYANDNGVPLSEAKKVLFDEAMAHTRNEINYRGCIDSNSKEYRRFQAALNETFSPAELAKFRADSSGPLFSPIIPAPVATDPEKKKMENYYKGKFDGRNPSLAEITMTADNTKGINKLFERLSIDPNFSAATDLNSLMAAHPELGADIGKLMGLKDQVERIEKKFGESVDTAKAREKLVSDFKELFGKKMWKDTSNWLKVVAGFGFKPSFNSFGKAVGETGKFMLKGIWAGSVITADIVKVSALYAKEKIT